MDALLNLSSPAVALNARLLKLESQVEADKAQLVEAKSKNRDFTDQAILFAALSTTEDLATRTRLRQEIRRKVARIDFWFRRDKTPRIWYPIRKTIYFPSLALPSPTASSASLCWSRMDL